MFCYLGDCYEPQDAGTGLEYEARWSFNADKAQCEPFYYRKQRWEPKQLPRVRGLPRHVC